MSRTRALRPPSGALSLGPLFVLLLAAATARAVPLPTIIAPSGVNYDNVGYAVGTAGDLNGDGYADVIVGATFTTAGDARVFFGGPKADDVADLLLTGAASGDHFGASVGTAGDVNGDGHPDLIVGAYGNDAAGADAGAAYVYFGGPGADAVADLTLTGAAAGDNFGFSVGTAGDVNGDGYADVVVGARYGNGAPTGTGTAYVYYGGASPDAAADLTLTGAVSGDYFGCSVGTAGDMNGDGYDDVIVGASQAVSPGGPSPVGTAYIFHGGASPNPVADLTLTNGITSEYFGCSVGTAGDVNGDGYDDIVVGAMGHNTAWPSAGAAYVYYGGASPNAVADLTMVGAARLDRLGCSVGTAGDVNADGYDDVVIGAVGRSVFGSEAGGAYVLLGGASPDTMPDLVLDGEHAADRFGYAVAAAGDVNGDGHDDVVVGAYGTDTAGSDGGTAYVFDLGPPSAAVGRAGLTALGEAISDQMGFSVGPAGDVNGDGHPDVIAGAPYNNAGGADAGRAYVYLGGPGADAVPDLTLTGAAASDNFGRSVGPAGDVNGDGYDDVVVGAHNNDGGGGNAGRAYVFFGSATPDATADLVLTGAAAGDWFGWSVGTAGDVNRDGYDDVVVGAKANDAAGTSAGRAYVFFGGVSPDAVADWTLTGAVAGDQFGQSVATAGDVNADGYADVIVGAYGSDAGGADAGRAYVFFGGTSPDAVADITLTGDAAGDNFGTAVGSAGHLNGDDHADVVVGAPNSDVGGANAGRVYVLFGGKGADVTPDLTMCGAAAGDFFGASVGTAGDVNNDGYADLVVGAYANDAGGTDAGRAYVFYGGMEPDTVADHLLTGAAGENFGYSVGAAGDFHGDGFPDVVVGAPHNSAGAGSYNGAVHVVDFDRYRVTYPNGGEAWVPDGAQVVQWLGAERADVWLSLDDGATYDLFEGNVGGLASNTVEVTVPDVATDLARVKVTPYEVWTSGSDASDSVFTIQGPTGVEPEGLALRFRAPWPNPSSGAVRFGLELARPTIVTVTVLDVAGREVARPIAGERFEAGKVTREWRPTGLAPGVYAVRASIGDTKLIRRLVWLGGR
jgi:hypothetical protein